MERSDGMSGRKSRQGKAFLGAGEKILRVPADILIELLLSACYNNR